MQALPQRAGGHQRFQFAHQISVAAQRQVRFDPVLYRPEPQFLQPPGLHLRERLTAEVPERIPAPQRQRRAKARGCLPGRVLGERGPALRDQPLEPVHIQLPAGDLLVIGAGRRGTPLRASGRVGRYCLHHAHCPVVAVPPPALARQASHGVRGWAWRHRGLDPDSASLHSETR